MPTSGPLLPHHLASAFNVGQILQISLCILSSQLFRVGVLLSGLLKDMYVEDIGGWVLKLRVEGWDRGV